ncbi:hypothetical protein [Streptomyces sp. NPDC001381]|uniref:hypothetical protein n=1 Tax=Streptomyces sp. NPDC001381 TaxID=3364567 RepID=UPI0036A3F586
MLGDVMGHGIPATTVMSQISDILRVIAFDEQERSAASDTASPITLGLCRPDASWPVGSNRCCLAPGSPGTQSAVSPNVQGSPVARGEAKRGRRPGPAFAGRAPCFRSRSGNWNTRRVRRTARTWRTPADGIDTRTNGRAFRRRHRFTGPRRRRCPGSRPCASAAARQAVFKSSCPALSPMPSRSAQPSWRSRGQEQTGSRDHFKPNQCRTSPEWGRFRPVPPLGERCIGRLWGLRPTRKRAGKDLRPPPQPVPAPSPDGVLGRGRR